MIVYGCAAIGMAAGGIFGIRQLKRWEIYDRRLLVYLTAGLILVFWPGAYLMQLFGYHMLKIGRYWVIQYALLLLALLDFRKRIIPNRVLLVLLGIRTVLLVMDCVCFPEVWSELVISSLMGLLGGGLIFFVAGLIARKGIGMGDVKLIAVLGYYLGFQVLMSDMVVSLCLTVLGGIWNLVLRKATMRSEMPFAPFVAAGTIITILLGC